MYKNKLFKLESADVKSILYSDSPCLSNNLEKFVTILNTPEKRWIFENNISFDCKPERPEKWYGYDKPKYYVGIKSDIYATLKLILMKYLSKDIFNLICRYVVENHTWFLK